MVDTDIFHELKLFFTISKVFGVACFDISGPPRYRTFLYKRLNIFILAFQFLLVLIIYSLTFQTKAFKAIINLKLEHIPELLLVFCCFILLYVVFILQYVYQNYIEDTYYKLEDLLNNCSIKIEYTTIKKFVLIIFLFKLQLLIPVICALKVYSNTAKNFLLALCDTVTILLTTHFCL